MARHWTGVWLFYYADLDRLPGLRIDEIVFLIGKFVRLANSPKAVRGSLGARQLDKKKGIFLSVMNGREN